ncbi:type VI secretion system ATPase TssH [Alkalilimnicola ehrlichii]|uniref:type VI secretion system ATPase TssH n=1 Tax=Alkalilimnicola ehrlichii TaxID=351052 RepID=UPI001C6E07D3|nr:type VI secretion system ATPase TssH [Alkalilimnicola ehrlichii]
MRKTVEAAAAFAGARSDYEVQVEHVVVKLLEKDGARDAERILAHFGIDQDRLWSGVMENIARLRAGNPSKPAFSAVLFQWFERAWLASSLHYGGDRIETISLIDALIELAPRLPGAVAFEALEEIPLERLREEGPRLLSQAVEQPKAAGGSAASGGSGSREDSALAQYTTDFTAKAAAGGIDPVLGRNEEIRMVIDILCRRRKNNPILVGEPGVGKTAVVEGLALKIAEGSVPEELKGVRLHGLDLGLLQAGASVKGEFERRLKQVIEEVKNADQPTIVFIDEAHTLIGAGGEAGLGDAANLLKPALARGEMRTVAATTWSEYKKYFERDAALERRFQVVKVDEPDEERAILMLNGLKQHYQKHHGVPITDDAVVAAVSLSHRYIAGRQLPDKAIDLLDTAAARIRLGQASQPQELEAAREHADFIERRLEALAEERRQGLPVDERLQESLREELNNTRTRMQELERQWQTERELVQRIQQHQQTLANGGDNAEQTRAAALSERGELAKLQTESAMVQAEVNAATVAGVVADWTGVPVGRMMRDEAATLMEFEDRLAGRVIGQEPAIAAIGQSLRAAKAGLRKADGPLGVFLLSGPSGVGKTETARAIADTLFGGERFLVTINMSEYQEAHTVSQLKGSPPGYVGYGEGGVLTEAVRQRPYSVVLLDEVEKAHPDVMNLFYQVFDRGFMRDGEGREIDFRNTVILMTSNLGAEQLMDLCLPPQEAETVVEAEAADATAEPAAEWTPPSNGELNEAIKPYLLNRFAPALLARMQVVPYRPLDGEALKNIIALKLDAVAKRLHDTHNIQLRCQPEVVDYLAAQCDVSDSGARFVEALLEQRLLPGIAHSLLGFMADDDMPDLLTLERDENGQLSCVFADLEPEPLTAVEA